MNKIKQNDVGAPFAFRAFEEDGITKLPLDNVEEAILRFKIADNEIEEREMTILLSDDPDPDLLKYSWQTGDLTESGIMKLEVLVKFVNNNQFTSLGYVKILVEPVLV